MVNFLFLVHVPNVLIVYSQVVVVFFHVFSMVNSYSTIKISWWILDICQTKNYFLAGWYSIDSKRLSSTKFQNVPDHQVNLLYHLALYDPGSIWSFNGPPAFSWPGVVTSQAPANSSPNSAASKIRLLPAQPLQASHRSWPDKDVTSPTSTELTLKFLWNWRFQHRMNWNWDWELFFLSGKEWQFEWNNFENDKSVIVCMTCRHLKMTQNYLGPWHPWH